MTSAALLFLRVVVGCAFVCHGWPKMHDPLGWMGPGMPPFLQALAAVAEFFGGIGWILGLLTPLASFGIACTMLVALGKHIFVRHDAYEVFELAAAYLAVAVVLGVAGPGELALDRWIRWPRRARAR